MKWKTERLSAKKSLLLGAAALVLCGGLSGGVATAAGQGQGQGQGGKQMTGQGGHGGGEMRGRGGKSLEGIFRGLGGGRPEMMEASDEGGSGSRGSKGSNSGNKGDLFGDLWIIWRDDDGVPYLVVWEDQEGEDGIPDTQVVVYDPTVNPLDAEGFLLDQNGDRILDASSNEINISDLEGFTQPVYPDPENEGEFLPIPLDIEGHPFAGLDEEGNVIPGATDYTSYTTEVELGRLNVGRAPNTVLFTRADEVITLLNSATFITLDAAGRIVVTSPLYDEPKTIDSPLENLAIYWSLLTYGYIDGLNAVDENGEPTYLSTSPVSYLIEQTTVGEDGEVIPDAPTAEDILASASFIAAATDKTGEFTSDEIAYLSAFLEVVTFDTNNGTITFSDIPYSSVDYNPTDDDTATNTTDYDRAAIYDGLTVEVMDLYDHDNNPDTPDAWWPNTVDVFEAVFGDVNLEVPAGLDAYTAAADDAREVIEFIHEYAIMETPE